MGFVWLKAFVGRKPPRAVSRRPKSFKRSFSSPVSSNKLSMRQQALRSMPSRGYKSLEEEMFWLLDEKGATGNLGAARERRLKYLKKLGY